MKKKRITISVIGIIVIVIIVLFIKIGNKIFISKNDVLGVDISHYQGNVDFDKLEDENIRFVFIKATEGAKYSDEMYDVNMEKAEKSNLYVGAYHFFSSQSSGLNQANNYIKVVGDLTGKLPPVVDVEVYGCKKNNSEIVEELENCLRALEEHYKVKPIIYTTINNYNAYVKSYFDEYPLWIRNVYFHANFINSNWTFWQYSDKENLNCCDGTEKNIDMNLFNGKISELEQMTISSDSE